LTLKGENTRFANGPREEHHVQPHGARMDKKKKERGGGRKKLRCTRGPAIAPLGRFRTIEVTKEKRILFREEGKRNENGGFLRLGTPTRNKKETVSLWGKKEKCTPRSH